MESGALAALPREANMSLADAVRRLAAAAALALAFLAAPFEPADARCHRRP